MISTAQFALALTGLLLQTGTSIVGFTTVITNEWIVIDSSRSRARNATLILGLTRDCTASHCFTKQYGSASSCGKSAVDVRDRYQAIVAFLVIGFLASFICAVLITLSQCALQKVRRSAAALTEPLSGGGSSNPATRSSYLRNIERITIASNRIAGVAVTAFVALLCYAIGIGLFNGTTNSFLHCGVSICDQFRRIDARAECGRGATYRFGLAAAILSGISLVFVGAWWVLNRVESEKAISVLSELAAKAPADPAMTTTEVKSIPAPPAAQQPPSGALQHVSTPKPLATNRVSPQNSANRDDTRETSSPKPSNVRSVSPSTRPEVRAESEEEHHDLLPPPEEGVWEFVPESGLYWGEEDRLYFDPRSGHFYDPEEDAWWNPTADEWYRLQ